MCPAHQEIIKKLFNYLYLRTLRIFTNIPIFLKHTSYKNKYLTSVKMIAKFLQALLRIDHLNNCFYLDHSLLKLPIFISLHNIYCSKPMPDNFTYECCNNLV